MYCTITNQNERSSRTTRHDRCINLSGASADSAGQTTPIARADPNDKTEMSDEVRKGDAAPIKKDFRRDLLMQGTESWKATAILRHPLRTVLARVSGSRGLRYTHPTIHR